MADGLEQKELWDDVLEEAQRLSLAWEAALGERGTPAPIWSVACGLLVGRMIGGTVPAREGIEPAVRKFMEGVEASAWAEWGKLHGQDA